MTSTNSTPIQDNRHLFEQQKFIVDAVEANIVQYSESLNSYTVGLNQGDAATLGFVNGAWFQWLEFQKSSNE